MIVIQSLKLSLFSVRKFCINCAGIAIKTISEFCNHSDILSDICIFSGNLCHAKNNGCSFVFCMCEIVFESFSYKFIVNSVLLFPICLASVYQKAQAQIIEMLICVFCSNIYKINNIYAMDVVFIFN